MVRITARSYPDSYHGNYLHLQYEGFRECQDSDACLFRDRHTTVDGKSCHYGSNGAYLDIPLSLRDIEFAIEKIIEYEALPTSRGDSVEYVQEEALCARQLLQRHIDAHVIRERGSIGQ